MAPGARMWFRRPTLMPRRRQRVALGAGVLSLAVVACGLASILGTSMTLAGEAPGVAREETALGARDAPVTVVEYFSFSCPHCARFHRETFPKLKRDYIDTGKVLFVLRDFPLNLAALAAAKLTRCVGPDRYFEIVDLFWRTWDDWIDEPDPTAMLLGHLRGAGLAKAVLERCENDRSPERQVLASYLEGSRDHGVDRTPTFLVNGRKYVGLVSYGRFAAILDSLLR